jgi:glucosylceramidase
MRRDMGIASTLWMPTTTSVPNGTYRLVPRNASWTSLAVNGASGLNGTATVIDQNTGASNQQFIVDLQSDGTYRIRTALSGTRPIELPNGVTDNGTKVKLWDDNSGAAQRWYFIPMGDGWYKIAPKSDMGKGIDLDGGAGATSNGTAVQVWDYLDGTNQQWKFAPATAPTYSTSLANGTYRITPRHATGSAMEVLNSNSANGAQIDISTYSDTANQKFLLEKQSDNSYSIRTSLTDNRALDLPFGDIANGNKLVIYDNVNSNNQRWYLVPTDNGWFKIAPKVDLDNKCVDVAGGLGSTANGTLVHNWDFMNATNQQWKFESVSAAALAPTTGSAQTTSSDSTSSTQKVQPKKKPSGANS